MTASTGATGITAYGAYIPITRLPLSLIAGRPAREGGPEKAVADYDEDAVTMAVTAAVDCLAGIDRAGVDALYFASTTYPLREKQGAALIAKALDLRRDVATQDHAGSLRAGTAALESALHAVAAGAHRQVLVVASDCRMGAPRGALESKLGDGAAAFLVGDAPIARFEAQAAVADELQDVWRTGGERFTHTWEDRFAIQEGYTPNLVGAVQGLFAKSGRAAQDFAKAALYAPDARSLAGVVRQLGLKPEQVQDGLFGRLGNCSPRRSRRRARATGCWSLATATAPTRSPSRPPRRSRPSRPGAAFPGIWPGAAPCRATTPTCARAASTRRSGRPAPISACRPPSASASATPTSASSARVARAAACRTSRSRASATAASRRTPGSPSGCRTGPERCSPTPSTTSSRPPSRPRSW